MTIERELDEILQEVKREHHKIEAPQGLESLLSAAAEQRKHVVGTPPLRLAFARAAALIALAAVLTAGLVWQTRRSVKQQNQQARSVAAPQAGPGATASSARVTEEQPKPRHVRQAGARHLPPRDSPGKQATWTVDEFVPLPVSEGLPPATELSVVRIKLKGSDLQQYGLQAPADAVAQTMLAEFVVGDDGLPRAIRIVR